MPSGVQVWQSSPCFVFEGIDDQAQLLAPHLPFCALHQVDAGLQRVRHSGRAGRGVNIGARRLRQPFHHGLGRNDGRARAARALTKSGDHAQALHPLQAKMRHAALPARAQRAYAVGIVHQHPSLVLLSQLQQARQIDDIAIHAEHAIGDDEFVRAGAVLQLPF